jgi:drug/metabolite transporter (DMT)-like permease
VGAVALALAASVGYGVSDFLGGLKSRSLPVLSVVFVSHGTALAVMTVVVAISLALGTELPNGEQVGLAVVAGLAEALAVLALYRGLAVGTMGVVAPVAACAPILPIGAAAALGELPGAVQGAGIAIAGAGVVLLSLEPAGAGAGAARRAGVSVGYGLATALCFGVFLIAMDGASEGGVHWALLGARLTSVAIFASLLALLRRPYGIPAADVPVMAAVGITILVADALYGVATTLGLLSVVAVLSSLYPVVTVALARVYLHERLARVQLAGIAVTLCGAATVSAG